MTPILTLSFPNQPPVTLISTADQITNSQALLVGLSIIHKYLQSPTLSATHGEVLINDPDSILTSRMSPQERSLLIILGWIHYPLLRAWSFRP